MVAVSVFELFLLIAFSGFVVVAVVVVFVVVYAVVFGVGANFS